MFRSEMFVIIQNMQHHVELESTIMLSWIPFGIVRLQQNPLIHDLQSANNEERHGLGASKQRYQVQENQQTYDDVVNNHHSMARESFDDWRNKQNQDVLLDDGKFSKRSKVGNNG
ncbi:hypothetical protein C4D60_Mb02t11400 [Musa balbisiana]|uniref:Uncharacterized protein n=1 Tax=Musa balbisiana TaxID=52838 RepID=A0A4S8IC91_MUSBA|nr:hypothetical protein C4D60_Mb02t11400 [Musa balbisiana]